jgi:hypothetical protein
MADMKLAVDRADGMDTWRRPDGSTYLLPRTLDVQETVTETEKRPWLKGERPSYTGKTIQDYTKSFWEDYMKPTLTSDKAKEFYKGMEKSTSPVAEWIAREAGKPLWPGSKSSLASLVTPEAAPASLEEVKSAAGEKEVPDVERIGQGRGAKFVPTGKMKTVPKGIFDDPLAGYKKGMALTKLGAEFAFGDQRAASEKLNKINPDTGKKYNYEDLSPSEKVGSYFWGLDLLPIGWFGQSGKQAMKQATKPVVEEAAEVTLKLPSPAKKQAVPQIEGVQKGMKIPETEAEVLAAFDKSRLKKEKIRDVKRKRFERIEKITGEGKQSDFHDLLAMDGKVFTPESFPSTHTTANIPLATRDLAQRGFKKDNRGKMYPAEWLEFKDNKKWHVKEKYKGVPFELILDEQGFPVSYKVNYQQNKERFARDLFNDPVERKKMENMGQYEIQDYLKDNYGVEMHTANISKARGKVDMLSPTGNFQKALKEMNFKEFLKTPGLDKMSAEKIYNLDHPIMKKYRDLVESSGLGGAHHVRETRGKVGGVDRKAVTTQMWAEGKMDTVVGPLFKKENKHIADELTNFFKEKPERIRLTNKEVGKQFSKYKDLMSKSDPYASEGVSWRRLADWRKDQKSKEFPEGFLIPKAMKKSEGIPYAKKSTKYNPLLTEKLNFQPKETLPNGEVVLGRKVKDIYTHKSGKEEMLADGTIVPKESTLIVQAHGYGNGRITNPVNADQIRHKDIFFPSDVRELTEAPQFFLTKDLNAKQRGYENSLTKNLLEKYNLLGFEFKVTKWDKEGLGIDGEWVGSLNKNLGDNAKSELKKLEDLIKDDTKRLKNIDAYSLFPNPITKKVLTYGKPLHEIPNLSNLIISSKTKKEMPDILLSSGQMEKGITKKSEGGIVDATDVVYRAYGSPLGGEGQYTNPLNITGEETFDIEDYQKGIGGGYEDIQDLDIFMGDDQAKLQQLQGEKDLVQLAMAPGAKDFFFKLFGKPAEYQLEGISKKELANLTKKQKEILSSIGQKATDIDPGKVFYSNLELSLGKKGAPESFASEKEFFDYVNGNGISFDEISDARIGPYVTAQSKAGNPILTQDILEISSQSPLNNLRSKSYGFRSEKMDVASKDIMKGYADEVVAKKGEPYHREAKYGSDSGIQPGYEPGTYRERVLFVDKDKFRGDPGTKPQSGHGFDEDYVIAWSRLTDRDGIIRQGEVVDADTGKIINQLMIQDRTKLDQLENKTKRLQGIIGGTPQDLVEKSGGRMSLAQAEKNLAQAEKEYSKTVDALQNERIKLEKKAEVPGEQEIRMTMAQEIQSDLQQQATRFGRQLALKLEVMAEQGLPVEQMAEGVQKELMQHFEKTGGVARPVGATKRELMEQYEELMNINKMLGDISKKRPYEIQPQDLAFYENIKPRQMEIIDSMADDISKDLMKQLYPDIPLKDRSNWMDAIIKRDLYEAAYRLFVEKDANAPTYFGVNSGDEVARAWSQEGSTATKAADRLKDKNTRTKKYKEKLHDDINTDAELEGTKYKGVGTHEAYGGPLSVTEEGKHYTGEAERSLRKLASDNNSKLVIINAKTSSGAGNKVYNIINQETGDILGNGATYAQAERIANDLVETQGGRYKIKKGTDRKYETTPIFGIKLTPEMLQLSKAYQ